ncbi:MAG: gluconate 2-dehydrogenase subunit 3 family protein [Lysobacterales bacterium]
MTIPEHSRRNFLKSGGTVFGAAWLAINMPLIVSAGQAAAQSRQAGAAYKNLSADEAVELDAWVNQIIPPDESPGAAEIGVVYFIDAALGGFMSSAAPMYRQGFEEFQQQVNLAHPQIGRFSELSLEQQTEMLKTVEDTPLFAMLYFMTLCGMFCLPSYGGNRENAGWELIRFDHRHAWQPPFGYYDAAVHGEAHVAGDEHEHV